MTSDFPFPAPSTLTVYGADWCGDCRRAKALLATRGLPHVYVDLLRDADAQRGLQAAGILSIPVIAFPDGRILIDPDLPELEAALGA